MSFSALGTALLPRTARAGRRVALVCEGGGMRGAFGAGVLAGLSASGLPTDAFDVLLGVSAGALNLMYWVSGRTWEGTRVYVEEIPESRDPPFFLFQNGPELFRRLIRGRPALDLRAVGRAMTELRPVDLEALADFPAPVWFAVTDAEALSTRFLDARSLPRPEVMPALLAGASVPVLTEPARLGEGRFLDGAVGAPLPVAEALALGCQDLVVVLNRPIAGELGWHERALFRWLARRSGVHVGLAAALREAERTRRDVLALLGRPPEGVRVTMIAPRAASLDSLERRRAVLERAVQDGFARASSLVREAEAA
jgi:predicted patatin/cPLA2 family phospholipase